MPTAVTPQLDELLELRHLAHAIGLASHHRVSGRLSGLYASVFRGQGLDYEESRAYQEGDDIRNMDWRVTARTGVGYLKVFREERERSVLLCVDCSAKMVFGTRATFKSIQAARAAALLGWSAIQRRDRVGALLLGDTVVERHYFRPSRSRQVLWQILRSLGQRYTATSADLSAKKQNAESLVAVLQTLQRTLGTTSLVFVIADLNQDTAPLESALGTLRQKHEVVLIPIDDPADWALPAMGRISFRSCTGSYIDIDTDSEAGRQQYQQAWTQRRSDLQRLAHRLGMAMIPLSTHREVHTDLIQGLARYARRSAALAGHG